MRARTAVLVSLIVLLLLSNGWFYMLYVNEHAKVVELQRRIEELSSSQQPTEQPSGNVIAEASILAPAVSQTGEGMVTRIAVSVYEGEGRILVNTQPYMGVTFQESARTAVYVACEFLKVDRTNLDFVFTVIANATVVEGGSAGAAMTVIVYSALSGREIDSSVMITGTINPDGTVGKVGGILQKLDAANKAGMKTFLIPEGQAVQVVWIKKEKTIETPFGVITMVYYEPESVDVRQYAREVYNITVVEVHDIEQVLQIMLKQ